MREMERIVRELERQRERWVERRAERIGRVGGGYREPE